jgi:hypothetical protein
VDRQSARGVREKSREMRERERGGERERERREKGERKSARDGR